MFYHDYNLIKVLRLEQKQAKWPKKGWKLRGKRNIGYLKGDEVLWGFYLSNLFLENRL